MMDLVVFEQVIIARQADSLVRRIADPVVRKRTRA
jgi:hypothetical protein